MNLSTKTIGLFLLLAFSIFSCIEVSDVGEEQVRGQLTDLFNFEVPKEASVVILDSIPTDGSFFAGSFSDNLFGAVATEGYSQLGVPSSINVPEGAVLSSFELRLVYDKETFYGTLPATQTISVHELTEELMRNVESGKDSLNFIVHYSDETVAFDPTPLGTATEEVLAADADSLFVIPLNNELGEVLLDSAIAEAAILTNQAAFNDFFKGVAIVSDGPNVLTFETGASASRLVLTYEIPNVADSETEISFPVNPAQVATFSNIMSDRAGTPIGGHGADEVFIPTDGEIFTQVGTGVSAYLNYQDFRKFADTVQNLVINSAELSVGPILESDNEFINPPSSLVVYFGTEDGELKRDTDGMAEFVNSNITLITIANANGQEVNQSPVLLEFDEDTRTYTGDMTVFMSRVANGKADQKLIFILNSINRGGSLNRFRVSPEDIQLEIIYSSL